MYNSRYDSLFNDFKNINSEKPIKTVKILLKDSTKSILLSTLIFILKNSPLWILPIVTGNIINIIATNDPNAYAHIWQNVAVLAVSLITNIPLHIYYTKLLSRILRHTEAGLRASLIRKLQELSIQYHKEIMSGKMQSKVLRDVEQIQMLCNIVLNMMIPMAVNILVSLVIAFTKNWMVALMYICVAPISTVIVFLLRRRIRERNAEFRKDIENMTSSLSEMVEMIPITRAHGLEDLEVQKMDHTLSNVEKRGLRLDLVNALFASSSFVLIVAAQVICLLFTSYLAYLGILIIGDVVLFQSYYTSIVGSVNTLINSFPQMASGIESIRSISEVLTSEDLENKKGMIVLEEVKGGFEFRDVFYKYPDANEGDYILKDFNLKVNAGESIAFVGESGSGKTTLLNMIVGYDEPTEGLLLIDRMNIKNLDLKSYRSFIAVVPQNNILFSGSIRENIIYGVLDVTEERLDQVLEMANVKEFVSKLPDGLNTNVGEHGGKLSGGQRQRIAIARALIRDPRIIVFDEATSALDSVSEAHVQKAINTMMKDRTVFMVAHRLSTIKEADRIVVIKNGNCVETGNYDELMDQQGEFYKYKQLQS